MTPAELKKQIEFGTLDKVHFSKEDLEKFRKVYIADFLRWFDSSTISGNSDSYRLKSRSPIIINKNVAKAVDKPKSFTTDFQNPCTTVDFCCQYLGLSFYQAAYAINAFLNKDIPQSDGYDLSLADDDFEDGELPF